MLTESPPLKWVCRNCDLLLTHRIWQKWWDTISIIKLHKRLTLPCLQTLLLASFDEENCHVGESHQARNWGWPPANSQQELKPSKQQLLESRILQTCEWTCLWIFPQWSPQMRLKHPQILWLRHVRDAQSRGPS